MYFTTEGPCSATNANYVEFIQKFMDDYWPKQKFQDQSEALQWVWDTWAHATNHGITKIINKAYLEIFNSKQQEVWYPKKTHKKGPPATKSRAKRPPEKKYNLKINPAMKKPRKTTRKKV